MSTLVSLRPTSEPFRVLHREPQPPTLKTFRIGMIGVVHRRTASIYRRELKSENFILPYASEYSLNEANKQLQRLLSLRDCAIKSQKIFQFLLSELQMLKDAYNIDVFTIASCGLEEFAPRLARTVNLPVMLHSENIAKACELRTVRTLRLLGTDYDALSNVSLVGKLTESKIEVRFPGLSETQAFTDSVLGHIQTSPPSHEDVPTPTLEELLCPHRSRSKKTTPSTTKAARLKQQLSEIDNLGQIAKQVAEESEAVLIASPELYWLRDYMDSCPILLSDFSLQVQAIRKVLQLPS